MSLRYDSLDAATRSFMRQELAHGRAYDASAHVGDKSRVWLELLHQAAAEHDDVWLAREFVRQDLVVRPDRRAFSSSLAYGTAVISIADDLAQTAFNHLYLRALCLRARWEQVDHLEIYCGKSRASAGSEPEGDPVRIAVPALMWALFSLAPRRLDRILGAEDGPPRYLTARFMN